MGRRKAQPNYIPTQQPMELQDTKLSMKARKELSKDPEVQERYSSFRKSTIPSQRMRNFVATKYDINISETSGSIIGTACKIFVGEVVEKARELMSKDKKDGQIEPKYYKMAYKIVTEEFRGTLFTDNNFTSLLI